MKKIVYFIYSIMVSFVCLGVVSAVNAPTVTADKDYITLNSPGASMYYYSVHNDFSTAVQTSSKISLRNGTYYFWARGTGVSDGNVGVSAVKQFTVTTSCSNQSKVDAKGQGTVERCYIVSSNGTAKMDSNAAIVSCASGYTLKDNKVSVSYNGCNGLSMPSGSSRFCKVIYSYNCVQTSGGGNNEPTGPSDPVPGPTPPPIAGAPILTSLNVNGYSISPAFSSGNKNYSLSVGADVSSVYVNATLESGASFVSGYGPRSVNLNYGSNKISVQIYNAGGVYSTYVINVNRADGRNTDNTLKKLSVDKGTLSPAFNSNTTYYSVELMNNESEIKIGAELNNSSASFVEGYGPRTVNVSLGVNTFYIKVRNERGNVKVYTVNVISGTGSSSTECNLADDQLPTLKEISFKSNDKELKLIEEFDPEIHQYTGIKVPYDVESLDIEAFTTNEGDIVEIKGNKDLEVNVPTNIVISVTSKACPTTVFEYNIEVTRQAEGATSGDSSVKSIVVKSYDGKTVYKLDFKPNQQNYNITVNKNEKGLDFEVTTADPNADISIERPNGIYKNAKYKITVTSSDGENQVTYVVNIAKIKSGASVFLIVIIIIILVLLLIYGVLRLLGYRIYFNTAMLGALFRGVGSKDKFDK